MQDSEAGPGACLACTHFGLHPVMPSVDPSGHSKDEADSLCSTHRARMTEGACVLCGRRQAWLVLHETSDIGSCRPCYAARFGEEAARDVEAVWRSLDVAGSL